MSSPEGHKLSGDNKSSPPGGQWLIRGAEEASKKDDPDDELESIEISSDPESNFSSLSNSSNKMTTSKFVVKHTSKRHLSRGFRRRVQYKNKSKSYGSLQIRPKLSDKNVQASTDSYICEEVGSDNSETYISSIYITSNSETKDAVTLDVEPFIEIIKGIAKGRIRIQRTPSGILVAFTKDIDADQVIKLRLQSIFNNPVQLARFHTGDHKFCKIVVIKDMPWCIPYTDILKALELQGIQVGQIHKNQSSVSVEVLNALYVHKLIEEGLNFFNHVTFPAELQTIANQTPLGITQCYKCQGFWHTSTRCRHVVRCVRCGENHDVTYCPRPRNSPICCHCQGPHHAAYKSCPVRLKHINSAYIAFQIAKDRPPKSLSEDLSF